jgi:hypothetical protein
MMIDSVDSFVVLLLLAPILSKFQERRLAITLGACDALASYLGGYIHIADFWGAIITWSVVMVVFAFIMRRSLRGFLGIIPVAASLDNFLGFPGHPSSAVCSLEFGVASFAMAWLGIALARYTTNRFAARYTTTWE